MKDAGASDLNGRGIDTSGSVDRLAVDVVSVLAQRGLSAQQAPNETWMRALSKAATAPDPDALSSVIADMRASKVAPDVIVDIYIPEVARRFGVEWENDTLSFAEVSIGTSRLQSALRRIATDRAIDDGRAGPKQTVLLHVPEGENHTLGAVAAACQLRRMGISVALRLNDPLRDVSALVASRAFDAILLSCADTDQLEKLNGMIDILRQRCGAPTPVFVGGALAARPTRAGERIGADFVTNNLDAVASQLGLRVVGDPLAGRK